MSKYRIITNGHGYKLQERLFGFLWHTTHDNEIFIKRFRHISLEQAKKIIKSWETEDEFKKHHKKWKVVE